MKAEKDFVEFGKEKMDQLKSLFEELEVQLTLGKAEAKELFEREKKNVTEFINVQRSRLQKEEELKAERLNALEAKMKELAALLVEESPDKVKAYDKSKETLLHCIYGLEGSLKEAYVEAGAGLRPHLDQFRNALDAYRIVLALSSFENRAEVEVKKEALNAVLTTMLGRFRAEEKTEEKLEHFVAEIETAFDHVKRAVKELIKS
jgi:hypothetical protein